MFLVVAPIGYPFERAGPDNAGPIFAGNAGVVHGIAHAVGVPPPGMRRIDAFGPPVAAT